MTWNKQKAFMHIKYRIQRQSKYLLSAFKNLNNFFITVISTPHFTLWDRKKKKKKIFPTLYDQLNWSNKHKHKHIFKSHCYKPQWGYFLPRVVRWNTPCPIPSLSFIHSPTCTPTYTFHQETRIYWILQNKY